MADDWVSVEQAARLANYNPAHIRRLIRNGEVVGRKIVIVWLVSRKSLEAYLHKQDKQGARRGAKPNR